jgi:DNA (cytosine-5)-methyltransferase 1
MTLTVGSLFSGIGGLDLGLERAGMRVVWQSEIDPYACRVLAKHWPEVPNHGDIKRIDWATVEPVDVICGGYPCQPFSLASPTRRGKDDPRHLWPWVRDAISALRPRYAILENVRGHLTLGGISVITDLAFIGYDAEWRIVPASGLGARHKRDRIIIVTYPHRQSQPNGANDDTTQRLVANAGGSWRSGRGIAFKSNDEEVREHARRSAKYWQIEPDVGRVANGIPNRVDRLRGLGNAVVPQVAEYIGRLVMEHAND